jgi:hypothetical protein
MDGIPGGTGETVPLDLLGSGLPALIALLATLWLVSRLLSARRRSGSALGRKARERRPIQRLRRARR